MKNKSDKIRQYRNPAILIIAAVVVLFYSCTEREYYVESVENPEYKPNKVFQAFDDMSTPNTEHLIAKFKMDTVFKGETDEFKRILLLRHWIKSVIPIKDYASHYPGEGNVERILDYALEGQGYDCGYFMRVQNAVMSSFGYVTRTLGAGAGVKGVRDGHHGINEIWLNKYNKWFLSDAKYDHHFEKDGIPLSALEVRNEYLKNGGEDILMVAGPDRVPEDYNQEMEWPKSRFVQTYTWITWDVYNDRFTIWPEGSKTLLIMYEDDYYKNNIWYRGGKPAWLYNAPEYLRLTSDMNEIYFSPNTIKAEVRIEKNNAMINLISDTPGLKEYQMKEKPEDEWERVDSVFELELKKPEYNMVFRTVNLAEVTGPEHRVLIKSN